MEQELQREWQGLQETTREILRNGYQGDAPAKRLFQALSYPTFEDWISWGVFEVAPSTSISMAALIRKPHEQDDNVAPKIYRAAKMQWQRGQDSKKFRDPVERLKYPRPLKPSIITQTNDLQPEFVRTIVERLKTVQIPAWPPVSSIGLDGTMYELIVEDVFLSVHYSWWEQPPLEWQPLAEVVQNILDNIEDHFLPN